MHQDHVSVNTHTAITESAKELFCLWQPSELFNILTEHPHVAPCDPNTIIV